MDKTRALQRAVDGFKHGTAALATIMGISPTTLRHKASPTYPTQSFSPEECIQLQRETGDHGGLMVEAAALGYIVLKAPELCEETFTGKTLNAAVREFGEFLAGVSEALEDGSVTANEMAAVDADCVQLQAAIQQVRARIAAMHELSKPAFERQILRGAA